MSYFENLVRWNGDVLKPEYQNSYDEFMAIYSDYGCSCFSHPPCNYCTHEGNPANLNENDDAWESPIKAAVRQENA